MPIVVLFIVCGILALIGLAPYIAAFFAVADSLLSTD